MSKEDEEVERRITERKISEAPHVEREVLRDISTTLLAAVTVRENINSLSIRLACDAAELLVAEWGRRRWL